MRFIAISLMLFSLSLSSGLANAAGLQQQLEKYVALAVQTYPPRLDISRIERLKLRNRLNAYWISGQGANRDFLFIKDNARYPFTISGIEINGETATAMVVFKPDTGSLIAAAPMASISRGRYTLNLRQNEWKLIAFEDARAGQAKATDSKPAAQTPAPGGGPRTVLDAYFRQLQVYYPPGRGAVSKNPMAIADETKKFWKLDTRTARSGHARSMSFFMIFRPSGWSIDHLSESGDAITVRVSFTVGNKDMLRLNKGSTARSVSYLLTREGKDWFLAGYEMRP